MFFLKDIPKWGKQQLYVLVQLFAGLPSGVKSCKLVAIEFIFHSFMWARVWAPVSLLLLCLINLRGAQKHSNSNPHET